jgi:hypothetical protein
MEQVMSATYTKSSLLVAALLSGLAALGCGDRPATWSASTSGAQSFGLTGAVALLDRPANRVVALGVAADGTLTSSRLPTGQGVVAAKVGPQGQRLYLLSAGHRGGLGDTQPDEKPRLTIVDGGTTPATARDLDLGVLTSPLDGLVIDPTERWAVVYAASGTGGAFVANPNELVIVDLAAGTAQPKTLHSFGGHPEKLVFAPELLLPKGPAHLLIVQSAQDFALVSLDDLALPEVTVRLADATAVSRPHPAEIVVDDGDPAKSDDARIGIRFDGGSGVMTLQLAPGAGPNGYAPTINLSDVGGVPSAIAFVRTDGGLRLAALVPARAAAVLVDPVTTITSTVALPAAYQSLSLVTAAAVGQGAAGGPDVALLWNAGAAQAGVAFWELGQAAGRPFRSIETVGIDAKVEGVRDVPGKNAALKVLSTAAAGAFYVLDLGDRTATPLLTSTASVSLTVSPTGERVWAFVPGGTQLAMTRLGDKHVTTLRVDSAASALYELARDGGGSALVVLHGAGGVGATVFDAETPDEDHRRIYGALLTEGPYEAQ